MERRLHLVETGPFAPNRWPSIATASAELRRPRHLRAVHEGASAASTPRAEPPVARAPLERRPA